jgi:hypothetical protein
MLSITHNKSNSLGDFTGTVTVFNSSGGSSTVAATDLVRPSDWNSNHVFAPRPAFFEPFIPANTNSTLSTAGAGTWSLDPFFLAHGLNSGQINLFYADAAGFLNGAVYSSASTGSISRYQTLNTQLAIYSVGSSDSYSLIQTVWTKEVSVLATWVRAVSNSVIGGTTTGVSVSNAVTFSFPSQFDSAGGMTYGTVGASGTTLGSTSTVASTFANNIITGAVATVSGNKLLPVPFNTTLSPGEYYLGIMTSSSSSSTGTNYSTGTMFSTQSLLGMLQFNDAGYKRLGASSASNSSTAILPFHGTVATTSTSPVGTLRTSDMQQYATDRRLVWNYLQSNY